MRKKRESFCRHLHRARAANHVGEPSGGDLAAAEEVDILRRAERIRAPGVEEHGSLEDEVVGMSRDGEPVDEPLVRVTDEQRLELLSALLREAQQALPNRRRDVREVLFHRIASRYGRMTPSTRQTRASRRSSSRLRFCRRYSRSASIATSRPILFRNLKQSATVFAALVMRTGTCSMSRISMPS